MGKLRDKILSLQKDVAAFAKQGKALGEQLEAEDQRVVALFGQLEGGCDMLWQYLVAKFAQKDDKIKNSMGDKLSVHSDSETKTLVKGINDTADRVISSIDGYLDLKGSLPKDTDDLDKAIADVRADLKKKQKRLLKSKKFKAKMATYETAVSELETAIKERRKALDELAPTIGKRTVEQLRLTPNHTLAQVESQATMSVQNGLKEMKKAVKKGEWISRRFRENGDLKQAHDMLKKLAAEADEMDAEALGLDEGAAREIKDVSVMSGRDVLATARSATFEGGKAMIIDKLTWTKGLTPEDYVKEKVTVYGKYVDDGGKFANDMKVVAVKKTSVKLG